MKSSEWSKSVESSRRFRFLLFLFCLVDLTEQGIFGPDAPAQLYGTDDQVYILNSTNLQDHIYGSSKGWVVEFFSSWCGHCIHFAPKWKQFALDLAREWENCFFFLWLDCADDANVAICREYEIMGYPSIRFFPPHSSKMRKGNTGEEKLFRGEEVDRSENLGEMKRAVVEKITPFVHNYYAMNQHTSMNSRSEVLEYIAKQIHPPSVIPSTVLVVFETETSPVAKEVALSLSKIPSVAVVRFTKNNSLYTELKLQGWPAAAYLTSSSFGKIPFGKDQNMPQYLLKMFAKVADVRYELFTSTVNVRKEVENEAKVYEELNNIEQPSTSNAIVSMEDLVHAVRNSLRNEVGLCKRITGAKLQALKNYVHTLAEFFPADRREMVIFLVKLSSWLAPLDEIDDVTYMDKLSELEIDHHPWDIDVNSWGNCKGSAPGRRGYPCSLWTLFHTLSVMAYEKNQHFPVLEAIHGFVKEFFGCKECAGHFTKLVADEGALMMTSNKDQVMWLWKAHNNVNMRIKGTLSEDPSFPKIEFPSEAQCPECHLEGGKFNEEQVLKHLSATYSKPERTLQPFMYTPQRIYGDVGSSRRQSSGFFSGIDYWLFGIVYLSVALLLVFGYIHFRTRRGERFDISHICCRRLRHLPYGKLNV